MLLQSGAHARAINLGKDSGHKHLRHVQRRVDLPGPRLRGAVRRQTDNASCNGASSDP